MTRHDAALAAVAAAAGGAIAFTWQPGLASLYDDSVFYLMMAQAFSPFGAAAAPVLAAAPYDTYPPFLPLLLALGGGAFDWRIAHAIVAACFGASVFVLGRHARAITGSASMGLAAAVVYAFMPGAWLNVKGVLAEFPYMALSFGILAGYARARDRTPSTGRAIALGALLAALLLTRTIGIALIAAIAASRRCAIGARARRGSSRSSHGSSRYRWARRHFGSRCGRRAARTPTRSSARAWPTASRARVRRGPPRWSRRTRPRWSTHGSMRC